MIQFINEHIIDLRKTKWDKGKSNPSKGDFVFLGEKVYYKPKGANMDKEWKLRWVRFEPPYRDFNMEKAMYHVVPVKAGDAMYYPEGCEINAEGYFQYGDVVLVREPRLEYLERRDKAVRLGEGGAKASLEQFKAEAAEKGVVVDNFGE